MRIRTLIVLSVAASALFLAALLYAILDLRGVSSHLQEARANMLRSLKLAGQVRQSSDDLTRMVRTYVVTGDSRYREYFDRILAIRNGEVPRPEGYDGIYWDFIFPGGREPEEGGKALSLHALMEQAGFTAGELALLTEAQRRSDALVSLERQAIGLVEAAAGVDEPQARAMREQARQLLHGLAYHRAKAEIMAPVARFIQQVQGRTEQEVLELERREQWLIDAAWLLLFANFTVIMLVAAWIGRRVLKPILDLAQQTRRVANGDYRVRVLATGNDEVGQLVEAFNTMSGAIQRDIDQREAREGELRMLRQRAEEASRAKSQFLANMSHELRTPMNAVLGYAQLLAADEELGERQRKDVGEIFVSGRHLLDLINDILDLSKVEAGKLELERTEFGLVELIEEVGNTYAPQAHAKGLELLVDLDPALPRRFLGDPTRFRQILVNLLGNAIKFTERGEVGVHARAYPGEALVLEVRDSGIGIAPGLRGRLFQPFNQADESTTRRFGGTGLGLALTRQLVEAMGGEIEVESEPGRGSRFLVRLPLSPISAGRRAVNLAEQRFLVVDDNAANRDILGRYLESWGAAHLAVDGGEAALAALREADYDWLLLDMQMPGMSGLELARRITAEAASAVPRMLLLTSAEVPAVEELAQAGIELALSKPVGPSRLLDALVSRIYARADEQALERESAVRYRGRVLVVEDNAVNLRLAVGMLVHFGLTPDSAGDGEQALARLAEGAYDLVLMDVQMPVLDGYEATRRLRERERQRGLTRTPVVALTANAMAGDREKALAAGMDDHLPKPVQLDDLAELLSHWLPVEAGGTATSETGAERGAGEAVLDTAALANLRAGLAAVPGGVEQILHAYLDEAPRLLEEIDAGLTAGDAERVARAAHSLKSQSAAVGAMALAEQCRAMEAYGRQGRLDDMDRLSGQAHAGWPVVRDALRRLVGE